MTTQTTLPIPGVEPAPPTVYQLTTLRDIWNLPTYAHMERCLTELSRAMLQARALDDLYGGALNAIDSTLPDRALKWPEVARWTDDGEKTININVTHPTTGEKLFSLVTSKKPDGAKKP